MWLTVVRHDHVRASMYMYHLVFDIVTSVNKRTDMSDIDRDTYLNRSPNLLFSVVGVARVFSPQTLILIHLNIRIVVKLEPLEFLLFLYSISYRIVFDTHYDKVVRPR